MNVLQINKQYEIYLSQMTVVEDNKYHTVPYYNERGKGD